MIHGSLAPVESVSWQSLLSRSITDPEQLLRRLELDPALLAGARAGAADFPLRVPEPFVERMHKGAPNDPLLRQVLPLGEELLEHPDYVLDPLGEQHTNTRAGIIHKYHGRSEEHTSELQSCPHLVCRLLLEKNQLQLAGPPSCSRSPFLAAINPTAPPVLSTLSLHDALPICPQRPPAATGAAAG